ncbi:MAG: VOC family protein [Gammaproteobacteria bacterium]
MSKPYPRRLGHLVLTVRDVQKSAEFYTDIVGLTVSDWISDQMVFMRCGPGHDHHDLALVQAPPALDGAGEAEAPRVGLEHFSYELENLEEIEAAAEFLQEKGIEIVRGIGKHGPGENLFLVFKDPDGNYVEYFSEMTQIDPTIGYEAKVWPDDLDAFDQWHYKRFLVPVPEGWAPAEED